MNTNPQSTPARRCAFTLIEVLIVIAIMALLAALIFPTIGAIKRRAAVSKAQTELEQVSTALDAYKAKLGHYPPDNPNSPITVNTTTLTTNQLYFELLGNTFDGTIYRTLDGSAEIRASDVPTVFGPGVGGFINVTRGGDDDGMPAINFLRGLKPGQYGAIVPNSTIRLLTCSVGWPINHPIQPVPSSPGLNPWRYVSSNPTNSPGNYDLWVDLLLGGKTYRISNWSRQPQIFPAP